jgi:hypothetical protein
MRLRRLETYFNELKYVIEEEIFYLSQKEPVAWSYLYIYDNNICTQDYLLKSVELAKQQAHKMHGVPFNIWMELESVEENE